MFKKGFTLAEVLITLAIIGIVAALTIPSVISNAQQQEFKTGLKKAVSVLNEAIQTNIAQEAETPYENDDLYSYLKRHMSIVSSEWRSDFKEYGNNRFFYTTDGMRFEFPAYVSNIILHESGLATNTPATYSCEGPLTGLCYQSNSVHCGSYGLQINSNNTQTMPCVILVDVNGDKKPNPNSLKSRLNPTFGNTEYFSQYDFPSPSDKKVTDVFNILITDEKAIPFGVVAQRAMYSK